MLEKQIFRQDIKNILLNLMVNGQVKPGDRISLPKIAAELEVSVTPIREALTQLTETRVVTYIANRGFFVTALSEQEASEIYEVITLLEGAAVKNSTYSAALLAELTAINTRFEKAENPSQRLQLDMEFHRKLVSNYENNYAHKIIEDIRTRVLIYEYEFMYSHPVAHSTKMHAEIIQLLQANEKVKAMHTLEANWNLSINHIKKNYNSKKV